MVKWPITIFPIFAVAVPAVFLWLGLASPTFAAAPFSPVANLINDHVQAPSSLVFKIHSRMHSNCANHYGKYHKHVLVARMRTCVEWAVRGYSDGRTERICTRWITRPVRRPHYKVGICSR